MFLSFLASTVLTSSPACLEVLDEIESKIQSNYVALALYRDNARERVEQATERYRRHRALASHVAMNDVLGCTRVLQAYVRSYDDPHLFLNSSPDLVPEQAEQRRASAPRIDVSPQILRQQALSATGRGPLVGIWAADGFEVAILPEGGGGFVAVVVESESEFWNAGDIAARFRQIGDEMEAVRYRAEDRAIVRTDYRVVSDAILSMPPQDWGRIAPAPQGLVGEWDPYNPRAPRFERISDDVAWVAIPTLSPSQIGDTLQAIAEDHRDDMLAADLLVVDLRGNNGGSASAIAPLDPFILTRDAREGFAADPYSPVLLSSPETNRYYAALVERMPPGLERDVFAEFVRRMEANPGTLQPLLTDPAHIALYNDARIPQALYPQPDHVALLVDGDVVSAGEAVLLRAGRSQRVTSFGASTRGSIDYQQVLMLTVGDGELQFALGYPLMADSPHLPAGGHNQNGVPVDVPLHGEPDGWPSQILDYYDLQ